MKKYLLFFGLIFLFSCKKKNQSSSLQYGTPYTNIPATTADITMYEVNERAYSATGDFNGITQRLDSIKTLGINVIWLMPINPIGKSIPGHSSVNSPYCVEDHVGLNSEFGSLSDLRNLISTAHSKNMAVILDWAANQTSWDNAWITEHPSWYEQDGSGNIISPPGYNFPDVAQLNYNNDTMRLQMITDMEYWIHTANFDGFRCDFADNVPDAFWAQAIDSLNNIQPARKLILLAEGGYTSHLTAGFQMIFDEGFYGSVVSAFSTSSPGTPAAIFAQNGSNYVGVPTGDQRLRFTTTHDHSAFDGTPMTLFNGKAGALAASVITINMGGTPMIYGSQEVGQTALLSFFNDQPIDWTQNPDMVAAYKTILAFRNSSEVVKTGTLTTYIDPNIVCYTKTLGSDSVVVIANVRNSTQSFTIPAQLTNSNWTDAYAGTGVSLKTTLALNPYQYYVLKNY